MASATGGVAGSNRQEWGAGADPADLASPRPKVDTDDDGTVDTTTRTDYHVDKQNHTGYAQVLEEMNGATGEILKSYTFGLDAIEEAVAASQVRRLLKDGHGSTRQLVDALGNVIANGSTHQIYAYDAYGIPVGFNLAAALTTLLYSGEMTDQLTGLQYLRARYYNPATGTFNRLDPFAGNFSDPQSLHKYLYCHADPVNGVDPTGNLGLAVSLALAGLYMGNLRAQKIKADMAAKSGILSGIHLFVRIWTWRLIGFVGGVGISTLVPVPTSWRVSSDDQDYANYIEVPAATNEIHINNRIAIDAATSTVNRNRMVEVLKVVRNTQIAKAGIGTCQQFVDKMAADIKALGTAHYDNSEYKIKRVEWTFNPPIGGWSVHEGLVVISKADERHVAYFDNGSFGDIGLVHYPILCGSVFEEVPESVGFWVFKSEIKENYTRDL